MNLIWHLLLWISIIHQYNPVFGFTKDALYRLVTRGVIPPGYTTNLNAMPSVEECALSCSRYAIYNTFFYHVYSRNCHCVTTPTFLNVSLFLHDPGWTYYQKMFSFRLYSGIPGNSVSIYGYSRTVCAADGGILARLTSPDKHADMRGYVESIQNTLKTILIDGRRIDDKWYLQTGDEMTYLPWRDGQPTNRVNQTFLAMRKDANCQIKDLRDGFQANMTPVNTGFLCEYD